MKYPIYTNSNKTLLIILFFILLFLIVVTILAIFLYKPIKNAFYSKKYKEYFYRKIYKIALYKDFYLINDFLFNFDGTNICCVDHILFGDKFIYFILDRYYTGNIEGKENDKSLVFTPYKGRRSYTDNPLKTIESYINSISVLTSLDKSLMVGIVLVNNECHSDVSGHSNQLYIVQAKKLSTLVKAIESRDVGKLNVEQLEKAVKSIDKMNRKRKN